MLWSHLISLRAALKKLLPVPGWFGRACVCEAQTRKKPRHDRTPDMKANRGSRDDTRRRNEPPANQYQQHQYSRSTPTTTQAVLPWTDRGRAASIGVRAPDADACAARGCRRTDGLRRVRCDGVTRVLCPHHRRAFLGVST